MSVCVWCLCALVFVLECLVTIQPCTAASPTLTFEMVAPHHITPPPHHLTSPPPTTSSPHLSSPHHSPHHHNTLFPRPHVRDGSTTSHHTSSPITTSPPFPRHHLTTTTPAHMCKGVSVYGVYMQRCACGQGRGCVYAFACVC